MLDLKTIATKLDKILNGVDNEFINNENPLKDFYFKVLTEGQILDSVKDMKKGQNAIIVMLTYAQGEYNAVYGIQEKNVQVVASFFFPLKYKDEIEKLEPFLAEIFVGNIIDFEGSNANTNIDPFQYGELTDMDVNQIKDAWNNSTLNKLVEDKSQIFMIANMNFYFSTAKDLNKEGGLISCNSFDAKLEFDYEGVHYEDKLRWDGSSYANNSEVESQQLVNTDETKSVIKSSAFGNQITIYAKNSTFYQKLLQIIWDCKLASVEFTYTLDLGLEGWQPFVKKCLSITSSVPMNKGDYLTIMLDLGTKI